MQSLAVLEATDDGVAVIERAGAVKYPDAQAEVQCAKVRIVLHIHLVRSLSDGTQHAQCTYTRARACA